MSAETVEETAQLCICVTGVTECPAHPYKQKRQRKAKPPMVRRVRNGECPACVFIKEEEHKDGKHPIYSGDVTRALQVGPVFCRIPSLSDDPIPVRGLRRVGGVPKIEVLEGEFAGVSDIWMNPA